jgi:nitroimidazol reductase NimA-like FMN-containing flavoprotein (pyridoxamine 5'-phosphate oxidase superfamily)
MSRVPLFEEVAVLSDSACIELLRTHHFGRIAFATDGLPMILPVNYVYSEPSIVIRTGPGTKLASTPQTIVAFEIDDADEAGAWGWSVVVQGPAFDITESIDEYSEALRQLPVVSHAPGERMHWLKIGAREVTGRRFGQPPA